MNAFVITVVTEVNGKANYNQVTIYKDGMKRSEAIAHAKKWEADLKAKGKYVLTYYVEEVIRLG